MSPASQDADRAVTMGDPARVPRGSSEPSSFRRGARSGMLDVMGAPAWRRGGF